ncbi:hypothetical protein [Kitasatospora kifunensis]|uniref:RsiW-degrading membrane proteinase PrsW (M82 family) n=1 Tax=Kitasatospora kifunensis TaxID=58351 RepID=A0A7W7R6Y4_KITKI|nr:hypothetical protein [Kitasatospora kifunensis]MBB4926389.1 RsiW-degrading membrane proteinase PrsW (M82 family) [Kitasatospora kifunensis]
MNPQHPAAPPEQASEAATGPTESAPPAASGLLRIYPTAYWRQCGEEIAALHWEAQEAATGPVARAREKLDLVGHALRIRLGISSATLAGRALGSAAPYVLVGTAASAAISLVPTIYTPEADAVKPYSTVFHVLLALALLFAVAGRWAWARRLALLGSAALIPATAVALHEGWRTMPARIPFLVVVVALLLCAPPDMQPLSLRSRWAMLGTAAAIVLPPVAWSLGVPGINPSDRTPWPVIVMAVVILAALARSRSNPAVVAGAFLAMLPWFCNVLAYHPTPLLQIETGAYAALVLLAFGLCLTARTRQFQAEHPIP